MRFSKSIILYFSLFVFAVLTSCELDPNDELTCTDASELTDEAYTDFLNSDINNLEANYQSLQGGIATTIITLPRECR